VLAELATLLEIIKLSFSKTFIREFFLSSSFLAKISFAKKMVKDNYFKLRDFKFKLC